MTLQRLVLDFRDEVLLVRCLYDQADPAIPGPNTKARARVVAKLARSGLEQALASLERDPAMVVGTSGFTRREDMLTLPRSYESSEAHEKGAS
jgi:hypothetical protein